MSVYGCKGFDPFLFIGTDGEKPQNNLDMALVYDLEFVEVPCTIILCTLLVYVLGNAW